MSGPPAVPPRTVVLVSGSGSNLQVFIDQSRGGQLPIDLAAVISDRPGAFALERARRAGIPAITVDYQALGKREAFAGSIALELERLDPELIVLAGFMRILPAGIVDRYRGRMLNVHPSLLPKFPGLHTYRRALEAHEQWHGSTVHFVTPELDAGPGIVQYRTRIRPDDTEDTLRSRVQRGEYIIYPLAIRWLASGQVAYRDGQVWKEGVPMSEPQVLTEDAA